jgi:hypothetical protein
MHTESIEIFATFKTGRAEVVYQFDDIVTGFYSAYA